MKPIAPLDIDENTFKLIGDDWMLIAAGNSQSYNMMTASWGGFGILWGDPVVYIFVRPSRYTYEYVEKNDFFSLNFFPEKYRKVLDLCGTKSGRDIDKMTDSGLTSVEENGTVYFKESKTSILCKKIYHQDMDPSHFLADDIEPIYKGKNYHRMYIGRIIKTYLQ